MRDDWEGIAEVARFCPTPHNTQPFRIRPRDAGHAELLCVVSRLLPREDHGNLYCMAGFGSFGEAVTRAGRHLGKIVEFIPERDVDPATVHTSGRERIVLGHARIVGTCAPTPQPELADTRRTSRLPYDGRSLAAAALSDLGACARAGGHRFSSYGDDDTVAWVLRKNVDAIIDNLQLDDEREEIRGWYRTGPTPAHGDGLWQVPMNQSMLEMRAAFSLPRLLTLPGIRHIARRRFLTTQAGTRCVGLLCGPFSTWEELLTAGRMLLDFWITMARHGVHMHPYGSMLTNAAYAREVAARFRVADAWLIFRLGYSPTPPRSPRLASIITNE
jgi:hypothetical protein